jgi:hypothetical protein
MTLKIRIFRKERMNEMNKKIVKRNALQAMMLVIFFVSMTFIETGSILPYLGWGISAASLALMN